MNLLKTIIERLNQRVEVANIFDKQFNLCELNANGNEKAWVHYIGNGQAEVVTNFDAKNGTLFWAKRGKVTVAKTDAYKMSGCKQLYVTSFPLTAYAIVRKSHLPCDAEDAQDWLASRVYKLTSGTDPLFKQSIGVINYEVVPTGYANEIKSLTANYEWACVSVDMDVQVITTSEDGCYDTCATGDIPLPDLQPCVPCLTEVAVDGVTITGNGTTADPLVAIGGGGGTPLITKNEGTNVSTNTTTLNFTGAGVTASLTSPGVVEVNVPGGGGGGVTSVTGTAPIASSGGATPDISITQADGTTDGYLSSTDWNTFDGKFNVPTGLSTDYLDGTGAPQPFPSIPTGTVTSVGTTGLISGGPITTSGTITTSMNTAKLVGRYSAGTGIMEEITVGSGLTLTGAGVLNNTATPTPTGYYGAFQDNTTQTAALANTAYAVKLNTTDLTNGVSVVNDGSGNPTQITLANTGIYNIQFSLQLEKTGGSGNFTVDVWVRKNGVDIPNTTGKVVLTGSANASPVVAAWNYVLDLAANDYVQLMWSTSNNNSIILAAVATPPHPGIPSAILTVTQQAGILAGTGITAINSLTGAAQSLVVGTSGTDFAISSTSATHTFNLPTASAANRGALSTADWTAFDAKQAALVSGTNIKTINSTSLLGSGNLATPFELVVAASDETTALTTGTAKITFRMPRAVTLTAVRASLTTAQASGSIFTVDINESGTSILSTKLTIDNTEKTSTTAATPPVISDTSLADDAEMTIDIDQIGNGTAKGLKVMLIGTYA